MKRYPTTAAAPLGQKCVVECVRVRIGTTRHFAKKEREAIWPQQSTTLSTFLIRSGSQEDRDALSKFPLSFLVPRITSGKKKRSHHPLFLPNSVYGKEGRGRFIHRSIRSRCMRHRIIQLSISSSPFPPSIERLLCTTYYREVSEKFP